MQSTPTLSSPDFPFAVTERSHPRARHIRISIGPTGQVLLTIPQHASRMQARAFLASRVGWVQEQLARQRHQSPGTSGHAPRWDGHDVLPLHGVERPLRWQQARLARPQVRIAESGIEVFAPRESSPSLRLRALRLALMREARLEAEDGLNREAHRLGLAWQSLRIGDPRAQWGNCTREGAISLSWRLLLAPPEVFRYVIIHELCHLPHPDHSPAFWALVARQMPDYLPQRQWLRRHGSSLHQWLPSGTQDTPAPSQPDLFG